MGTNIVLPKTPRYEERCFETMMSSVHFRHRGEMVLSSYSSPKVYVLDISSMLKSDSACHLQHSPKIRPHTSTINRVSDKSWFNQNDGGVSQVKQHLFNSCGKVTKKKKNNTWSNSVRACKVHVCAQKGFVHVR